jgi:hypothetical protein
VLPRIARGLGSLAAARSWLVTRNRVRFWVWGPCRVCSLIDGIRQQRHFTRSSPHKPRHDPFLGRLADS